MPRARPYRIGHHRSAWHQGTHALEGLSMWSGAAAAVQSSVPRPLQPPAPEAGERDIGQDVVALPPSHGRQAAPEEIVSEPEASARLGSRLQGRAAPWPTGGAAHGPGDSRSDASLSLGASQVGCHPPDPSSHQTGLAASAAPGEEEAPAATLEPALAPAQDRPAPAPAPALRRGAAPPAFILQDHNGPFQPLLKVSQPIPVGAVDDRYAILLRRAAPTQSYGLTFLADEGLDRDLHSVRVAEDLPHIGVRKGDAVLMVNNRVPRSSAECLALLREAASLLLVFQTRSQDMARTAPQGINNAAGGDVDNLMQVPLAVVPPIITDLAEGEFLVVVRRSSLHQKFGIDFGLDQRRKQAWQAGTLQHKTVVEQRQAVKWLRGAPIVVAGDVPHLGLCQGDLLLTVNDCQPQSEAGFQFIFERSRILKLVLLRSPEKLADMTALPLLDLDSEEAVGGWLESSNVIGTDGTGGAQEDFFSIELPTHLVRGRDCSYPWQLCTHSCNGAPYWEKIESEMEIVGWDAMGGEVKAFVSGSPSPLGAGRQGHTRPRLSPHAATGNPHPYSPGFFKSFWSS